MMFSQKTLKIILVFSLIGFSLNTNLVHLDTLLSLNTVNYTEIEQKKKSELEKKLAEQNAAENAEKEKAQQEKKVNELVTSE